MSVDEAYSGDVNQGRKLASAFRTIGEVAEELDVPQHILRFWEKKFNQLEPVKQRGRRYYRPEDIELLNTIKTLLYKEGYTVKGVQKHLLHCDTAPLAGENQLALFGKQETTQKSPQKQASIPLLQAILGKIQHANEALKEALTG